MNYWMALEAVVAAYLIIMSFWISTNTSLATFIFKVAPFLLGVPLSFYVMARLLGWPV